MKVLVVYESQYGNTARVARAIATAMEQALSGESDGPGEVELLHVNEARPDRLAGLDLLVVGCPTQKFGPMPETKRFLKAIPKNALEGIGVTAFDTRITEEEFASHSRVVSKLADVFGYAAEPIAGRLQKKGGRPVVQPEGFYVGGTEGPLLDGELERAAEWGRQIVAMA